MSHAMHRTLPEDRDDFVVHVRSTKDINRKGASEKLRSIIRELEIAKPVVFGNPGNGCTLRVSVEEIRDQITEGSNLHITYSDYGDAYRAIKMLRDMGTGLSVSIAGPLARIFDMASELSMEPDSVLLDLGTFGPVPHPEEYVSEIVSLCGHMRVSPFLVRQYAKQVKSGQDTAEEASANIGRHCRCGCFNTTAAANLLREEAARRT